MIHPAIFFFLSTFCAIVIHGLFSLFEMSAVSFNKVRLQYYVSQGKRRAIWLNSLLSHPSRLFGTTLIGVNTALQIGSECARRFYESIHLDPDWAPVTQIFIVVIFAELAPMIAARRHPEQLAMNLVPLMITIEKILAPIIWAFDAISRLIHSALGKSAEIPLFLSREEVKMAFEEEKIDDFNAAAGQIFQLKNMTAGQCMTPLGETTLISSNVTVVEVRHLLSVHYQPLFAVYHRYPHNVVGVVHLRDLLKMEPEQKILEHAKSPWFVPKETSILQILEQFRRNGQSLAVILDVSGQACGLLTLDQIVDLIFGEEAYIETKSGPSLYIERTLSGEMSVEEFNRQFQANLPAFGDGTLSDLIISKLDHPPVKEEMIRIEPFLFTVIETTLTRVRTLSVQTLS